MEYLEKFFEYRNKVLKYFLIFIVGFMVVTVTWQVFTRLVTGSPSVWTEEASGYLLSWCGLIGAAYAYGTNAHVGMSYFFRKLDRKKQKLLDLIITIMVAYFAYNLLIRGGQNYVNNAFINNQTSPTMNLPVGYLNLCLPVSGIFILTYSLEFFIKDLRILIWGNK